MCLQKVEVQHICAGYNLGDVLQDINFTAREGEFIGLIGPNGSGKSTLLHVMSKILNPTCGTVYLGDVEIESMKLKEVARVLAVIPQDSPMTFSFTVADIVIMGRNPHLTLFHSEGKEDIEIARKAMEATDTFHLRNRVITNLSGGERQRVIIARALAQSPKVLLLDEPTANLDIRHQIEIFDLVKRLTEEGLIVICAIHDLNLASLYSDRLIVLKEGRVLAFGNPEEVLTVENMREIFGVEAIIQNHPVENSPFVILMRS
ncbi:MAG: heme ABC transporter ATP-binding protein [Theionarchaea archaeon]|nr:heme ABC transporter ATP-binding protein [Theionarchaea archaeon]MBU7001686.1 heme ABC transporter ATP-binding protein [Theionarchaea archaeon]